MAGAVVDAVVSSRKRRSSPTEEGGLNAVESDGGGQRGLRGDGDEGGSDRAPPTKAATVPRKYEDVADSADRRYGAEVGAETCAVGLAVDHMI